MKQRMLILSFVTTAESRVKILAMYVKRIVQCFLQTIYACVDPESFVRIQIPLKVGHHQSASETVFKWRFDGGSMMALH